MPDDPPNQNPASFSNANPGDQQVQFEAKVEDAETRAAREELKQTVISDAKDFATTTTVATHEPTLQEQDEDDEDMQLRSGRTYEVPPPAPKQKKNPDLAPPEVLSQDAAVTASATEKKIASPKKKRAHDEVEEHKNDAGRTSSGTESESWVMVDGVDKNESHRSEPQKKRARDETSPPADIHRKAPADAPVQDDSSSTDSPQPQTSSAAFAASGFSKLASASSSPFASLGATKSVFGGGAASSPSPFASLGATASTTPASTAAPSLPKPTLSFGSKDASAPSPFATINGSKPSAFGGGFGGNSPFASALGGTKTGNFATPGIPPIIKSDKPAKPFGAPDSDADDDSEDGTADEEEGGGSGGDGDKDDTASRAESTPAVGDDEKKARYKKVVVDDGEAGEATVVAVRARMYYLDKSTNADGKQEMAWRERGVGNLKVNVPLESVTVNEQSGAIDAKSFDASTLGKSAPKDKPKVVRLVMRQDSTLRVILNTVMLAEMNFQRRDGFKATNVLFTAIDSENGKPLQVQMKMSPQSADNFIDKVEVMQKRMKEAKP